LQVWTIFWTIEAIPRRHDDVAIGGGGGCVGIVLVVVLVLLLVVMCVRACVCVVCVLCACVYCVCVRVCVCVRYVGTTSTMFLVYSNLAWSYKFIYALDRSVSPALSYMKAKHMYDVAFCWFAAIACHFLAYILL
jgi:hypothetical protein